MESGNLMKTILILTALIYPASAAAPQKHPLLLADLKILADWQGVAFTAPPLPKTTK
jgi:hypothetical protein